MGTNYSLWQKKIGNVHLCRNNESDTLCGRPMLGTNYAHRERWQGMGVKDIPKSERCPKCYKIFYFDLEANRQLEETWPNGRIEIEVHPPKKSSPKETFGSIQLAQEFDRVKEKVVLTMNRCPKPTDQIFAKQIDQLLRQLEEKINDWWVINDLRGEKKDEG